MDPRTFDRMIQRLSSPRSRRSLVGGSLGAAVLAALGPGEAAVARKRRGHAEAKKKGRSNNRVTAQDKLGIGARCDPSNKEHGKKHGCRRCRTGYSVETINGQGKTIRKCACKPVGEPSSRDKQWQCCSGVSDGSHCAEGTRTTGTGPTRPGPETRTVSCPPPFEALAGASRRWAQSFTAPISGLLTSAQVEIWALTPDIDITLDIRTLNGAGVPTATVLDSARIENVPNTATPAVQTVTAIFASPASVQAGVGYALAVTVDPGQGFAVSLRSEDDCAGHGFLDLEASNVFAPVGEDLVFSVTIVS